MTLNAPKPPETIPFSAFTPPFRPIAIFKVRSLEQSSRGKHAYRRFIRLDILICNKNVR